jgi:hypothetical protein
MVVVWRNGWCRKDVRWFESIVESATCEIAARERHEVLFGMSGEAA